MLRSTFSTLRPVLQTFIVIAKLSGRKTKFFLVFFLKDDCWSYLFLSYLSEVKSWHIKEGGRGLKMSSILF